MGRRRGTFGSRIATLTAVVIAAALVGGCDWTALNFGPANTNFNAFEPELNESSVPNLEVAWSNPCACRDRALVAGGVVYVVSGFGATQPAALTVRTFDAENGDAGWSAPLGSVGNATVSAVANGLVYVLVQPSSGSQRIVAFDAATGAFRWRLTPPEPGSAAVRLSVPIVDGALAFVIATVPTRSDVFAIDTRGRVVWSAAPGGSVTALTADSEHHVVYAASRLFLTSGPWIQLLTGYAEADGSVRSAVVPEIPFIVGVETLGVANGLVVGTQPNDHGEGGVGAFAVHPDTGALAWSGNGGIVAAITPSTTLEFALRADPDGIALDTNTGAVRWRADIDSDSVVAGDLVYTFAGGGIRVLRLSDGSVVTTVPVVDFGALTPANGQLYVAGSQLYALAPS
jgi:outer membrane protein assembly factor BamB